MLSDKVLVSISVPVVHESLCVRSLGYDQLGIGRSTLGTPQKQGGPESPKARRHTAHSTPFFKKNSCGVGICALHEIDVRSLLKHRAH